MGRRNAAASSAVDGGAAAAATESAGAAPMAAATAPAAFPAGAACPGFAGMNPGMMMANPMMMANQMMMANPMMAAMMMGGMGGVGGVGGVGGAVGGAGGMGGMGGMCGMPGMMGGQLSAQPVPAAPQPQAAVQPAPEKMEPRVDPQVRELCRAFNIEDRLMKKLNDAMMRRDTFEDDLQTVREKLSQSRPDIGVLIRQLEQGNFVSKNSMHRDVAALVDKYQLDDRATHRLVESMTKRKDTMKEDLKHLDVRLASAERPSGLLMTLLQGLDVNGELPAPPRSLGLGGSYRGGGSAMDRDRDRDRRSRERRERSRSRSRRRR